MKLRSGLIRRSQYSFFALVFAALTWSRLHERAGDEAVLYAIALVASIFLAVLPESVLGVKKTADTERQDESGEAAKP